MSVAETIAREAGQDFIRDIVRGDLLPVGSPALTARTG